MSDIVDFNKGATVVKLAVIGDVFKEKKLKPLPNDQIRSFNYTLMGDNAFKFVIELVNYDQAFLSAITKSVNNMTSNMDEPNYTNLDPDDSNLQSLPKLLIQFGYENHIGEPILSQIHFANISEVKYKFSQGQEKILVITSIFNPTGQGDQEPTDLAISQSTQYVDVFFPTRNEHKNINVLIKPASPGGENKNDWIEFYDLTVNVIRDLIQTKDGFSFNHLEPDKEQRGMIKWMNKSKLKRALSFRLDHPPEEGSDLVHAAKEFLGGDGVDAIAIKVVEGATALLGDGVKHFSTLAATEWSGLVEFAKEAGLTFTRRYDQFSATSEATKTLFGGFSKDKDENVSQRSFKPPVGRSRRSGWIPSKNTKEPVRQAAMAHSQMILEYTFNDTCGGRLSAAVNELLNSEPGDTAFQGRLSITQNQAMTIADGVETPLNATLTHPSSQSGVRVHFKSIGSETVAHKDGDLDTYMNLKKRCQEIWPALEEAMSEDEDLQNAIEADEDPAVTPDDDGVPTAGMTDDQKKEAFNRNIQVTATSEEGTSVFTTIDALITGFNKKFSNGKADAELVIDYQGYASAGDFNTILAAHEEDPLRTRVLDCVLGLRPNVNKYKEERADNTEFEVLSSPITKESDDHRKLYLSYGRNTSITKFFDFTGDIRWLRNISTSIASNYYIDNMWQHLNSVVISRSFSDVVASLLSNPAFIKELKKSNIDKTTDIDKTLGKMRDQVLDQFITVDKSTEKNDRPAAITAITLEELQDLRYVAEYIRSGKADESLQASLGDDYTAKISSFNLFIAALYNEQSIPLLMDFKPKDKGYYIKPSNIFDNASVDARPEATKDLLSIYASNLNMFAEVQLKTIGIPELTTLDDITTRNVVFDVYDPSEDTEGKHWLSGLYVITAFSHSISPSEGYTSELTLAKVVATTNSLATPLK